MDGELKKIQAENKEKYKELEEKIKSCNAVSGTYMQAALCMKIISKTYDKRKFNAYLEKAYSLAKREIEEDLDKKPAALLVIAEYYKQKKDYKKAADFYMEAANYNQTAYYFAANVYIENLNDKKSAIAVYEQVKSSGADERLINLIENRINRPNCKKMFFWVYIQTAVLVIISAVIIVRRIIEIFNL